MIYLDDLQNATGGQIFGEIAFEQFPSFAYDIEKIEPGQLFVAVKNPYKDGHQHIDEAIKRGAKGILCQAPPTGDVSNVTVVLVGDTFAALNQWTAYILRRYNPTVIGITGAIGKSTTKEAVNRVLSNHYQTLNTPHDIPIPLALGRIHPDHQIVLIELAPSYTGEMPDLLNTIQPHLGIITNATPALWQYHPENERIKTECQQMLQALPEDGTAILNNDDEFLQAIAHSATCDVFTYGITPQNVAHAAHISAHNVQFNGDKITFDVQHGTQQHRGRQIPQPGRAGFYASMAALTTGLLFDIPISESLRFLSAPDSLPGRLRVLRGISGSQIIDDTYHGTPSSAYAALEILAQTRNKKRIFIVGDLDCHPPASEPAHQEIGRMAAYSADLLITCGEKSLHLGTAAREAGMDIHQTITAFRAADIAHLVNEYANPDDVIVITGGQRAQMTQITQQLLKSSIDSHMLYLTADQSPTVSSWIELDLDAIAQNIKEIKKRVSPPVKLIGLVEANAYGHGMAQIASVAVQNGIDMLGVNSTNEGCTLRQMGIATPILVMGYTSRWDIERAILNDLMITIYDGEMTQACSLMAQRLKRTCKVHIRIDVGLGLSGLLPEEAIKVIRTITRTDSIEINGLYAHFSVIENPAEIEYTRQELERFSRLVDTLKATGIHLPTIHAAGSAGILTLPEAHFNAVRAGLLMYGIAPSPYIARPPRIRPALTWKTNIIQVKSIPAGWYVGYGNKYQVKDEDLIAIIPVGYADGFSSTSEILIKGQRAPVLGNVAMNQSVIYVSHIADIQPGEEGVLLGQDILVEELAQRQQTTSYQILSRIPSHIPRIIKQGDQ